MNSASPTGSSTSDSATGPSGSCPKGQFSMPQSNREDGMVAAQSAVEVSGKGAQEKADFVRSRQRYRFRLSETAQREDMLHFIKSHSTKICENAQTEVPPSAAMVWVGSNSVSSKSLVQRNAVSPFGSAASRQQQERKQSSDLDQDFNPVGTVNIDEKLANETPSSNNDGAVSDTAQQLHRRRRRARPVVAKESLPLCREYDEEDEEPDNPAVAFLPRGFYGSAEKAWTKETPRGIRDGPGEARNCVPQGRDGLHPNGPDPLLAHVQEEVLRKRLLNEDFFTDPIRKLRRDGRFPFKLTVSLLTLLLIIVHLCVFQVRDTSSDELQRSVMIHHFSSDDYESKANGDIVTHPRTRLFTRDEVTDVIRDFVSVYYNIAKVSVSDLNFYVGTNAEEMPGYGSPTEDDDDEAEINTSYIKPVDMKILVQPFNLRERSHVDGAKWLTLQLTEDNMDEILAPFERAESDQTEESSASAEHLAQKKAGQRGGRLRLMAKPITGATSSRDDSWANPSASALLAVCAPRVDEITGLLYLPCRDDAESLAEDDSLVTGDIEGEESSSQGGQSEPFSVMDNVLAIHLSASLRHLSDNSVGHGAARSAFRATIYHWDVEKHIEFRSGGLVHADVRVSVSTLQLLPQMHGSFFITGALLVLAIVHIPLRIRAVQRAMSYRRKLKYERNQFLLSIGSRAAENVDVRYSGTGRSGLPAREKMATLLGRLPFLRNRQDVYYLSRETDLLCEEDGATAGASRGGEGVNGDPAGSRGAQGVFKGSTGFSTDSSTSMNTLGTATQDVSSDHLRVTEAEVGRVSGDAGSTSRLPLGPTSCVRDGGPLTGNGGSESSNHGCSSRSGGAGALPVRDNQNTSSKAGLAITETIYRDFADTWRQQLQSSMGHGWHYLGLVAALTTIAYCTLALLQMFRVKVTDPMTAARHMLLGSSGLLNSVLLLSYLRYFPRVYFTIRATRRVIPRLIRFAFSVSPVFFAFVLFFIIVFGPHSNGEFANLNMATICLYFMMYGDALLPAIDNAANSPAAVIIFLANLMTIIFVFLFMMTMLNIAMAIAQQEWAKLRRQFGACLSTNNILFDVRSREEVRREAMDTIVSNLELLLYIRREEQHSEN